LAWRVRATVTLCAAPLTYDDGDVPKRRLDVGCSAPSAGVVGFDMSGPEEGVRRLIVQAVLERYPKHNSFPDALNGGIFWSGVDAAPAGGWTVSVSVAVAVRANAGVRGVPAFFRSP